MRTKKGTVISNKMDKTVVVEVISFEPHPLYKKRYRKVSKLKARDEKNECQIGDTVMITETRPYSKSVYFKVTSRTLATNN